MADEFVAMDVFRQFVTDHWGVTLKAMDAALNFAGSINVKHVLGSYAGQLLR